MTKIAPKNIVRFNKEVTLRMYDPELQIIREFERVTKLVFKNSALYVHRMTNYVETTTKYTKEDHNYSINWEFYVI